MGPVENASPPKPNFPKHEHLNNGPPFPNSIPTLPGKSVSKRGNVFIAPLGHYTARFLVSNLLRDSVIIQMTPPLHPSRDRVF